MHPTRFYLISFRFNRVVTVVVYVYFRIETTEINSNRKLKICAHRDVTGALGGLWKSPVLGYCAVVIDDFSVT